MKHAARSGLLLLLLLTSCAPLFHSYETPIVAVSSFRVLPGDSIVPTFEIGLHVSNPNRVPLTLQGLSYHVSLEGHRVLGGVTSQLPEIPAYGEGDVLLQARPDLFSTISLFNSLMNQPRESFRFSLEADLDVGGLMPNIRITKEGQVSLKQDVSR